MNCEHCEVLISEEIAIGGTRESLSRECREHLAQCEACNSALELELELNHMLEEPIPLPPGDLTAAVMARIELDAVPQLEPDLSLAWGERLAWMVSGAALMFGIERIPSVSSEWLFDLQSQLSAFSLAMEWPGMMSPSHMAIFAVLLISVQGAMVAKVKGEAR